MLDNVQSEIRLGQSGIQHWTDVNSGQCWIDFSQYVQSEIRLKILGESQIGLGQCLIGKIVRPMSDWKNSTANLGSA
jgi:hypothetical protein